MGSALAAGLLRSAADRGVQLKTGHCALRLLQTEGRITGAVFGHAGGEVTLHARRGVVLATGGGLQSVPMAAFLTARDGFGPPGLILRVEIPRSDRRAAHARLTMRKAGDYPCAIVSVSAEVAGGTIRDPRIAVGAVEATARRWTALERALTGSALDPAQAEAAARGVVADFTARDAVDAPGWYRLSVLPVLLRRALTTLQAEV